MKGFRSLSEDEEIEFESQPSDKGVEATFVCGVGGGDCRGSERRPASRKKFKKIRSVLDAIFFLFRLLPSWVTTTGVSSQFVSIFCNLLCNFNHFLVLYRRIHVPSPRPSPFPPSLYSIAASICLLRGLLRFFLPCTLSPHPCASSEAFSVSSFLVLYRRIHLPPPRPSPFPPSLYSIAASICLLRGLLRFLFPCTLSPHPCASSEAFSVSSFRVLYRRIHVPPPRPSPFPPSLYSIAASMCLLRGLLRFLLPCTLSPHPCASSEAFSVSSFLVLYRRIHLPPPRPSPFPLSVYSLTASMCLLRGLLRFLLPCTLSPHPCASSEAFSVSSFLVLYRRIHVPPPRPSPFPPSVYSIAASMCLLRGLLRFLLPCTLSPHPCASSEAFSVSSFLVLYRRIHVPPPRPSPFPPSWQLHPSSSSICLLIIFAPYMSKPSQSCLSWFLSKLSHLRCPSDGLVFYMFHCCYSYRES